jgi:hypothetical protein
MTRALLLLTLGAALALAGCTDEPASREQQPDVAPPLVTAAAATPFAAQLTKAPAGYHVEQCPDLRSKGNGGLAVRLIVPDSYTIEVSWERTGCSFTAELSRHLYLDFGPLETLASYTEREIRLFEGDEGDDSISGVHFVDDVPVFGRTVGGQLDYRPYNDGLPLETRILQSHGLRLQWDVKDGRFDRFADELAVITSSVALVEDDRATCSADGRTMIYVPPLPQVEAVDLVAGSRCFLYLRPRDGLLRHAEIDVAPQGSLAAMAARLERRPAVSEVALAPGAARLDGRPADRLTWVLERTHNGFEGKAGTYRVVAIGTADVQVTWSAEIKDWPRDRGTFQRLLASVHTL